MPRHLCSAALALVLGCLHIPDGGGSDTACTPGELRPCQGPPGCQAYQVCDDEGAGFGACACPTDTSTDAPTTSGGETGIQTSTGGLAASTGDLTGSTDPAGSTGEGDPATTDAPSSSGHNDPCDACNPATQTCEDGACVDSCTERTYTFTNNQDNILCNHHLAASAMFLCSPEGQGTNNCSPALIFGQAAQLTVKLNQHKDIVIWCCLLGLDPCGEHADWCGDGGDKCGCEPKKPYSLNGDSCAEAIVEACP